MYIYIYIWNQENTFSLLGRSKCSPSSSFRVICAFTLSEGFLRLPHSEFETWLIHKCSKWFVHLSHWKRSDLCLIQSVLSTVQFRVICAFISSRVIWVHFLYTHTNYTCTFLWVHFAGDTHLLSPYICTYIYIFEIKRTHSHYYSKQRIQPDDDMYVHFIPHVSLAKWKEHILMTT